MAGLVGHRQLIGQGGGLGDGVDDGLVTVYLVLLKLMGDHALNRL